VISQKMQQAFEAAYSDTEISPQELISLRETVDQAANELLEQEGSEGALDALCKSFDVTSQLIQHVALGVRSGTYSDLGKTMVASVIESQVAFLNATARAFR
jgi:hypothetical protein